MSEQHYHFGFVQQIRFAERAQKDVYIAAFKSPQTQEIKDLPGFNGAQILESPIFHWISVLQTLLSPPS